MGVRNAGGSRTTRLYTSPAISEEDAAVGRGLLAFENLSKECEDIFWQGLSMHYDDENSDNGTTDSEDVNADAGTKKQP